LGERFRFLRHDLTTKLEEKFDYGYCTDVLEHIPPEDVDKVLLNICTAARRVYFAISTVPDVMGALVGEPLHLTVESPFWWHDRLSELGFRIDWSWFNEGVACFYGTAYASAKDFIDRAEINVNDERLKENICANLSAGYREVVPHEVQPDTVVYLLAGGPSLADYEEQIVQAGKEGKLIVTTNGTYNWLIERGIRPAAQMMVDGRKFNKRFVTPIIDTCKYLISSQCDPEVLQSIPKDQVWMWHSGEHDALKEALKEFPEHECYPVHGGTTIITRALTLLAMLGFRKVEVFGWDSCLRDKSHHAYAQPENDSEKIVEIEAAGRKFLCHPWMIVQASDFQVITRHILSNIDGFEMVVHGDGLISHLINTAAELADRSQENGS